MTEIRYELIRRNASNGNEYIDLWSFSTLDECKRHAAELKELGDPDKHMRILKTSVHTEYFVV